MKWIHTADWHLGKLLGGISLHRDQSEILESFLQILREEKPDVILLAGDVYDRSYPPVEAVSLLNDVFEKILLELKIPMIVITGNHDHADRLDFGSGLMEKSGLYLRAKLEAKIVPITLEDDFGIWKIYPIPYASPATVRALFENREIRSAQEAMCAIVDPISEEIRREKAEDIESGKKPKRYVAIAHSFFIGSDPVEESDSERMLSIGGTDAISADIWKEFDYVALGHLHKAQKVQRETIRYAGSLLKYSFSEVNHHKSVVVLDWQEELQIRWKELIPKRNLRIVEGTLQQILEQAKTDEQKEDYILARLADKSPLFDPIYDLKAVYPNVLGLEYIQEEKEWREFQLNTASIAKKDILEMFSEFHEYVQGDKVDVELLKEFGEGLK